MTMPDTPIPRMEEMRLRSAILVETTNFLNLVGQYMSDESNSPQEDQDEAALNDRVAHLVEDHHELVGHMLIAMGCIIVEAAPWQSVQEWLTDQEERIKEEVDRLHADNQD